MVVPTSECLCCGHVLPLKVWHSRLPDAGVCEACWYLAHINRGACSDKRGCSCGATGDSLPFSGVGSAVDSPGNDPRINPVEMQILEVTD